ncbi:MAG: hypothetical protein QNL61_11715 [Crocinitomicaceae bacterium]
MKKLVLAFGILCSSLAIGQEDPELQVGIDNMMSELAEWNRTTRTYKTGDNDALALYGLLESIFSDMKVKEMYGVVNPRIFDLRINSLYNFSDDNTMSYEEWVKTILVLDTADYDFNYKKSRISYNQDGSKSYFERIRIYSKKTGEKVRCIFITYNADNLRSIFDSYK